MLGRHAVQSINEKLVDNTKVAFSERMKMASFGDQEIIVINLFLFSAATQNLILHKFSILMTLCQNLHCGIGFNV